MTRRIGGDREDVDRCRSYRPEGDDDLGLAEEFDKASAIDFLFLGLAFVAAWLVVAVVAVEAYRLIRDHPRGFAELLAAGFVVAAVRCWTHDKAQG
jgi:hypothetical protein